MAGDGGAGRVLASVNFIFADVGRRALVDVGNMRGSRGRCRGGRGRRRQVTLYRQKRALRKTFRDFRAVLQQTVFQREHMEVVFLVAFAVLLERKTSSGQLSWAAPVEYKIWHD